MLKELRIKNFAIIDSLAINLENGLNVLTGETGAGKSIIVDAIGLLLGDKASSEIIKSGQKEAYIEAYFENSDHPLLKELGIDCENGITLRRNISLQGKGRSYINDTSAGLQTLSLVGASLIDIHGQNEHQGLLKKESHLSFIDSIGKPGEILQSLKLHYEQTGSLRKALSDSEIRISEMNQRLDLLRFQINEIDSFNLRQGEKESLEEELTILQNLSKLKENSETAYNTLYKSDGSCIEKLSSTISNIKEVSRIDRNAGELLEMLEAAYPLLEDSAIFLRKFKEKYEADPLRIDEINGRLDAIKRLENKYRKSVEDIIQYRRSADEDIRQFESMDEQSEMLKDKLMKKEQECLNIANELSKKRFLTARQVEKRVTDELKQLGFSHAEFQVLIKKKDTLTQDGFDEIEFLFSGNPGEPVKPLSKVASGGELSRIMLALKCAEITESEASLKDIDAVHAAANSSANKQKSFPKKTLIFDEVDAGIGGITAQNVGMKLKAISGNYHVICITHLPQIAAMADNHLIVEKILSADSVKITVDTLTQKRRQEELARMLSGKITDGSLKHAQELLGN